jgi:hypothetical protein
MMAACEKEECKSLIPKKVAGQLAQIMSCAEITKLTLGEWSHLFQTTCVTGLLTDPDYQWHCG